MENNLKKGRKGVSTGIKGKSERFSIRKFKVGVGSTLLGTTLLLTGLGGDVLSVVGLDNTFSMSQSNVVSAEEVDGINYEFKVESFSYDTERKVVKVVYDLTIENTEGIKNGDIINIPSPYIQSEDGSIKKELGGSFISEANRALKVGNDVVGKVTSVGIESTGTGGNFKYNVLLTDSAKKYSNLGMKIEIEYNSLEKTSFIYSKDKDWKDKYVEYPYSIDVKGGTITTNGQVLVKKDPRNITSIAESDSQDTKQVRTVLNLYGGLKKDSTRPSGYVFKFGNNETGYLLREYSAVAEYSKKSGGFSEIKVERDYTNGVLVGLGEVLRTDSKKEIGYSALNEDIRLEPVVTSERVTEKNSDLYFIEYEKGDDRAEYNYEIHDNGLNHTITGKATEGRTAYISADGNLNPWTIAMKVTNEEVLSELRKIEDDMNSKLHTFANEDGTFNQSKYLEAFNSYDYYSILGIKDGDITETVTVSYDGELFTKYDKVLGGGVLRVRNNTSTGGVGLDFKGDARGDIILDEPIDFSTEYKASEDKTLHTKFGEEVSRTEGEEGLKRGGVISKEPKNEVITVGNYKRSEEELPYEVEYEYTLDLEPGVEVLKRPGEEGLKETYERYSVDINTGELSKTPVETTENTVKEPVNKIILKGYGEDEVPFETEYKPSNNKEDYDKFGEEVFVTEGTNGVKRGETVVEEPINKEVIIGNYERFEEEVPFETKEEYTLDLKEGETRVKQEGQTGLEEYYNVYEVDGKTGELSKTPVETTEKETLKEPVTKIVEKGYPNEVLTNETTYKAKYETNNDNKFEDIVFNKYGEKEVIVEGKEGLKRGETVVEEPITKEVEVNNVMLLGEEDIPFETIIIKDRTLKPNEKVVETEGELGKKVKYVFHKVDSYTGTLDDRRGFIEEHTIDPVDEVIRVGLTYEELLEEYKEKLDETIEEYDNKIKELEEELNKTKEEVGNNKEEYEKDKAELENKIKELEEQHKKEIEELEKDFNDKIELINEDLTKKETELENLKEELENQKQQNEEDKTLLEDRIKELEEEITKNKEDCAKAIKEIEDKFNKEIEDLETNLAEKEKQLEELSDDLGNTKETLTKEIEDLKEEIAQKKEDCKEAIKELEDKFNKELEELNDELNKTNQELEQLTERVTILEEQKQELEQEIESLKQELKDLEESNKQELDKTKEEFNKIISELKQQLNDKDVELKDINDKINELEKGLEQQDKDAKEREAELRQEIDNLVKEKERLEDRLKELEESDNLNKETQQDLLEKIEDLNKKLEELNDKKADKTETEDLNNKVTDLENNKADKEDSNNEDSDSEDSNNEDSDNEDLGNEDSNNEDSDSEDLDSEDLGNEDSNNEDSDSEDYSVVADSDDNKGNGNGSSPNVRDTGNDKADTSNTQSQTQSNSDINSKDNNVLPDTGINQESNILVSGVALLMGLFGGLLLIRKRKPETDENTNTKV